MLPPSQWSPLDADAFENAKRGAARSAPGLYAALQILRDDPVLQRLAPVWAHVSVHDTQRGGGGAYAAPGQSRWQVRIDWAPIRQWVEIAVARARYAYSARREVRPYPLAEELIEELLQIAAWAHLGDLVDVGVRLVRAVGDARYFKNADWPQRSHVLLDAAAGLCARNGHLDLVAFRARANGWPAS